MPAQPSFHLVNFPTVCLEREDKLKCFRIRGGEIVGIEPQKFPHDRRHRSFIAADPRVILNQPEAERRSLPDEVCIFLKGGVLRAREREPPARPLLTANGYRSRRQNGWARTERRVRAS